MERGGRDCCFLASYWGDALYRLFLEVGYLRVPLEEAKPLSLLAVTRLGRL